MLQSLYMSTAIQDKPNPKATKGKTATAKQKVFAEAYTDPSSDTYLNGTQSALRAYDTSNPKTAGMIASRNIATESVLNYMEKLNDDYGIGTKERSQLMGNVLNGVHRNTTKTTHRDADGNIRGVTEVEKSLTPTEIFRGIDLANRAEGLYNKANVAEHVAKREYDERIAAMRADMKEVIASHRKRGEGDEGSPT